MIEKLQFSQILIITRKNGEKKFLTSKTITINQENEKKKYSLGYYPVFFKPFNQERKIKYLSSLQSLITRFFQNLFCILTADRDWDKRGMKFKTRSQSLVIPRTCQKRGLTSGNRLARLRRLGHDATPAENRRFAGHN